MNSLNSSSLKYTKRIVLKSKRMVNKAVVSLTYFQSLTVIYYSINGVFNVWLLKGTGERFVFFYALRLKHLMMTQTISLSYLLQIFEEQHTNTRPPALISCSKEKITSTLDLMLPLIFQECLSRSWKELHSTTVFRPWKFPLWWKCDFMDSFPAGLCDQQRPCIHQCTD